MTGDLVMDVSTLVGRQIAIIDASAMTGSAVVAGLDQGIPFAIPVMDTRTGISGYAAITLPVVTFSGNTVSWQRQGYNFVSEVPPCQLVLGVY
ncbi:hypothetical protein [Duganella sp. Leaf126]|uniref:hypothetical protein n=1 Tax=Duganella sp. Leaf126 TaxID=1736266 RepID=UPI0012E245D2|nr:hypothetical protein [Duganella sp. Leaf126]